MNNLQNIYEQAYKIEWQRRKGTSSIRIVSQDPNTGKEKVYEEGGNFFLCGFTNINFHCKGNNLKLKSELKEQGIETSKHYYGGLNFGMKKIGNRGNGDYEIQNVAYQAVADYLNSIGYDVWVNSRLD